MTTAPTNEFVEVRNGAYYVAGTRIGLDVVYYAIQREKSVEGIFEAFPSIGSRSRINGAIAFMQTYPEAVQEYLREQDQRYKAILDRYPLPPEMVERFEHGLRELHTKDY